MPMELRQAQIRDALQPQGNGGGAVAAGPAVKEIPYDYVARFTLKGTRRGERVQDVINISTDGVFVATAIGYSFVPNTVEIRVPPIPAVPPEGVIESRVGRALADFMAFSLTDPQLVQAIANAMLVRFAGIDFKYVIVDSGSGRELQNQAIHNIAGLGSADGDRPFRPLAKPMHFQPRSTIRIEVEELSLGPLYEGAELFIVFHGYKILGYGT
jgi:hypothetical protein